MLQSRPDPHGGYLRRRVPASPAPDADLAHARGHLPCCARVSDRCHPCRTDSGMVRSEEHTSELQSLMRISYAVFCLKKKNNNTHKNESTRTQTTYHQVKIRTHA